VRKCDESYVIHCVKVKYFVKFYRYCSKKMASFEADELQSSGSTDRAYNDSDNSYIPFSQNSQNFDYETFDRVTNIIPEDTWLNTRCFCLHLGTRIVFTCIITKKIRNSHQTPPSWHDFLKQYRNLTSTETLHCAISFLGMRHPVGKTQFIAPPALVFDCFRPQNGHREL